MKTILSIAMITAAFFMLPGCSKDSANTPSSVAKKIESSTWEVTYYWDKDKDETYKFQGYTFEFKSSSLLEATKSGNVESGSWVFDDSDDSHDHFIISFPAADPLEDLVDDWEVIQITDSIIELMDESGSGGIEYLTFKKKS